MKLTRTATASGLCEYWIGGQGSPLLLIHGGWAGAEAHWAPVWLDLAKRHRVIAIELEGLWRNLDRTKASYHDYVSSCADLLTALQLTGVAVAGNSLGASIGWQLAANRPDLVRHLIMVNGFPPRKLPIRKVLGIWPFRPLALKSLAANFYSPAMFKTAFFNPSNAPEAIKISLAESGAVMAAAMFRILCSVATPSCQPAAKVDFVWGEQDRLPSVKLADGRKLCAANPASRLFPVPAAGHLPQVENPLGFVAAIGKVLSDDGEGAETAHLEKAPSPA